MALINENFLKLSESYLFTEIARKVNAYKEEHPKADVISLGIGDVTQPLAPAVIEALHKATDEMTIATTFRGYGPERGYNFLREAIVENDFHSRGIDIEADEVFVSDGAKSDTGNFQELLSRDCVVAVTDPVYPVYIDANTMAGREVVKLPCTPENSFVPELPTGHVDVIYLCYPNNPTGTTLTKEQLKVWVDYAIRENALIFYDAAYEAYIQSEDVPHSIYEIPDAKQCAVEFHSYSKTAGFTGIRCGYTESTSIDKIQRHKLSCSKSCGSYLYTQRQDSDKDYNCLLYGECTHDAKGVDRNGLQGLWRHRCALPLGPNTWQHDILGVLRLDASFCTCSLHSRRWFWCPGRRLRATHSLWNT